MQRALMSCVLLALAYAAPMEAQARRGAPSRGPVTFAIAVTEPSGTPVSGVKVTLSGAVNLTRDTEGGRTVFENLPAGVYRLRFEKPGFVTLEREVQGRGAKPIDVKVTLVPEPPPPPAPVAALPTLVASPAKLVVLDMPAFIEKHYVGREPGSTTPLGCGPGGAATLLQINEPLSQRAHADADEFIYVIAGQGMARFGERAEPLGPAVFLMIPRGTPHTLTAEKKKPLVLISVLAGASCGG